MAIGILESTASQRTETLADLLDRLGNVPLERIRFHPYPGTATEKDAIAACDSADKRLCELIEGTLVEKAMSTREALLASLIGHLVWDFLEKVDLGVAIGADGMLRLWPGRVRLPDLAFISWDQIPSGEFPGEPVASLFPDLAVEVLSPSNTRGEIQIKIRDFFRAGTRLVWVIDPRKKSAEVYHSPTDCTKVGKGGILSGEDVLPGFKLSLRKVFASTRRRKKS